MVIVQCLIHMYLTTAIVPTYLPTYLYAQFYTIHININIQIWKYINSFPLVEGIYLYMIYMMDM